MAKRPHPKTNQNEAAANTNLGGILASIAGIAFIITVIVIEMLIVKNSTYTRTILTLTLLALFATFLILLGMFFYRVRKLSK
jgi:hypothetical protein